MRRRVATRSEGAPLSRLPIALFCSLFCLGAGWLPSVFAAETAAPAADERYAVEPPPAWTSRLPVPEPRAAAGGSDIEYLLVDRQLRFAETLQEHHRVALRMLNES